jgi:hypothetical protein
MGADRERFRACVAPPAERVIPHLDSSGLKQHYFRRTEHDNLYFVAFTRARKALEVYYQDVPHAILNERYGPLVQQSITGINSVGEQKETVAFEYDEDIPF